ncbi:MAG: twin-arginine translocase TatA/TatE family subunit [Flavobacteriales bacterium]
MMEIISSLLLLWMPSATELIIIAVVILLLFGGRKIPELMRGLGKGVKEFKEATNDGDEKGQHPSSGGSSSQANDPDKEERKER